MMTIRRWLFSLMILSVFVIYFYKQHSDALSRAYTSEGHTEQTITSDRYDAVFEVNDDAPAQLIEVNGDEIHWRSLTPAAHRAVLVDVPPSFLDIHTRDLDVGKQIELPLFDGTSIVATITHSTIWGNGTRAVRARIAGDSHGFLTLSSTGGVMRILVESHLRHTSYQVRYDAERGEHVLLEIDEPGSHVEKCGNDDACGIEASDLAHDTLSGGTAVQGDPIEADSDNDVVVADVMFVYTQAAREVEGSLANIEANISQALLLGNQVLENSNTLLQLNLVHSVEVDYTEGNATNDLRAITYKTDGKIDHIHELRDYYAADFVVFVVDTDSVGGLGWRPVGYGSEEKAFCLVRVQQSDTTSYTTIHEISHNMGNSHSKSQRSSPYNGNFVSYSAGWQWADATSPYSIGYCSVMTYENFDSTGDKEYDRVPHFSNPSVFYDGNATGDVTDADAARVIREGRNNYISFRDPLILEVFDRFPYEYGFEASDSQWRQSVFDDHSWTLDQEGDTDSSQTGPANAYSGERYGYVEASSNFNTTAILEADFDFSTLRSISMLFRYHMFGGDVGDMGDLFLDVSTDAGASWETLWSKSGEQGSAWELGVVNLNEYAGESSVRLRFKADVGASYRSDIALDDIFIYDGLEASPLEGFAAWIGLNYPEISDSSPDADPDNDGIVNFLEFALGLSPIDANVSEQPSITFDPTTQFIEFEFARGRANLRYQVQSVTQLEDWSDPTLVWDSESADDLVEPGNLQRVRIDQSQPQKFIRLNVSE